MLKIHSRWEVARCWYTAMHTVLFQSVTDPTQSGGLVLQPRGCGPAARAPLPRVWRCGQKQTCCAASCVKVQPRRLCAVRGTHDSDCYWFLYLPLRQAACHHLIISFSVNSPGATHKFQVHNFIVRLQSPWWARHLKSGLLPPDTWPSSCIVSCPHPAGLW